MCLVVVVVVIIIRRVLIILSYLFSLSLVKRNKEKRERVDPL